MVFDKPGGYWSGTLVAAWHAYDTINCEWMAIVQTMFQLKLRLEGSGFMTGTEDKALK